MLSLMNSNICLLLCFAPYAAFLHLFWLILPFVLLPTSYKHQDYLILGTTP